MCSQTRVHSKRQLRKRHRARTRDPRAGSAAGGRSPNPKRRPRNHLTTVTPTKVGPQEGQRLTKGERSDSETTVTPTKVGAQEGSSRDTQAPGYPAFAGKTGCGWPRRSPGGQNSSGPGGCGSSRCSPGRQAGYQLALWARPRAYSAHQAPALGPPLQAPSDSPGCLIQRNASALVLPVLAVGEAPKARPIGLHHSPLAPLPLRLVSIT